MKEIIFIIEEGPEGGYKAQCLGYSIFTEAETIKDLEKNIIEALRCHFDKEEDFPKIVRLHFVREEAFNYAQDTDAYVEL